jgi:MerR family copper efflux transcriptional regulator
MLINELSKRTGITVHTIRFYEKSGLIKGRRDEKVTSNNYFHYDEDIVSRLEFIRDAKSVGFTINEISQMIDAWYSDTYTQEQKLALLNERLTQIERKITELNGMKAIINEFKQSVLKDEC